MGRRTKLRSARPYATTSTPRRPKSNDPSETAVVSVRLAAGTDGVLVNLELKIAPRDDAQFAEEPPPSPVTRLDAGPSTPPAPAIPPRRARTADPDLFEMDFEDEDSAPAPAPPVAPAPAPPVAPVPAPAPAPARSCAWAESSAPVAIPSRERRGSGGGGAAFSAPSRFYSSAFPELGTPPAGAPLPEAASAAAAAARAEAEEGDDDDSESEEEGVQCAICHGNIRPLQVALVRGCEHPFCTGCILNWALQKKKCPLCVTPFTHLWLYKQLDGTFNDYLHEENVDLLHCATWFKKEVASSSAANDPDSGDEYHEQLQYEYGGGREEEDEAEFYFDMQEALALGRRRGRTVGNRMWGSGGVRSGGKLVARVTPVAPPPPSTPKGKGKWAARAADESPAGSSGSGGGSASRKAAAKAEKLAQKDAQKEARRTAVAQSSRKAPAPR